MTTVYESEFLLVQLDEGTIRIVCKPDKDIVEIRGLSLVTVLDAMSKEVE